MDAAHEHRQGAPAVGLIADGTERANEAAPPTTGPVERVVVRRGALHDPVTLMEASQAARPGACVEHVGVGMVEPLNMVIFQQRFGYAVDGGDLGPNDLVIAVR